MATGPEAIPSEETAAVTADTYEEELLDYDPHDEDLLAEELKAYGEEGLDDVMSFEDGQGGAQARGTEVAVGQQAQYQVAVSFNGDNQPEQKTNSTKGSPQRLRDGGAPCSNDEHTLRDGIRWDDDRDGSRNSDRGPQEGGRSNDQRGAPERRPARGDERRREDIDDKQHRQDQSASLDDRGKSRDADHGRSWDLERDRDRDNRDSGERDNDRDREHQGRERDKDWERDRDRDREANRGAMYDSERDRLRTRAREWELERTRLPGARHDDNHTAAGVVSAGIGASTGSKAHPPTLPSAGALAASPPGPGSTATADPAVLREEHRARAPYGPANMWREEPFPYHRGPKGSTPPNGLQERSGQLDRDQEREGEQGPDREREQERDTTRRDYGPLLEGDSAARGERVWERERDRDEGRRPLRPIHDRLNPNSQNLGSGPAREQTGSSSRDGRADGGGRYEVERAVGRSESERPGGSGRSEYDKPRRSGQEYDRSAGSNRLGYDHPSVGSDGRPDCSRPGNSGRPEYDRQYSGGKPDQDRLMFSNRSEYDRAGPGTGRPEYDRGVRSESYDRLGGGGGCSGDGLEYGRSGPAGASRDRLIRASSTPGIGDVREDRSRLEALPHGHGPASRPPCSRRGDESPRSRRAGREWDGRGGLDDRDRDRDYDRDHDRDRDRDRNRDRDRGSYRNWELRDKDSRDKELWEHGRALRDHDRDPRDRELRDRELWDRDVRDRELRDRDPRDRDLWDRKIRNREARDRKPRDRERDRSPERWGSTTADGNGGEIYGVDPRASLPRGGAAARDTADWRRWPSPLDRGTREFTPLAADTSRGGGGASAAEDAARRGEPWRRSSIENLRGIGGAAAGSGADEAGRVLGGLGNCGEGGDGSMATTTAPRIRAPLFVGSVRPPPDVNRPPSASHQQHQRRSSPEPPAAHQQPPQQQEQQPDALETDGETANEGRGGPRPDLRSEDGATGSHMAPSVSGSDTEGSPATAQIDDAPGKSGGRLGERMSRWRNANAGGVGSLPGLDAAEPATETRPQTGPATAPKDDLIPPPTSPHRTPLPGGPANGDLCDSAAHQNPLSRPRSRWEDRPPVRLPPPCFGVAAAAATVSDTPAGDGAMEVEMATTECRRAESSGAPADDWDNGGGSSGRNGAIASVLDHVDGPVAGTGAGMDAKGHGGDGTQQSHAGGGKACKASAAYSLQDRDRVGMQHPSPQNGRQQDGDAVPRARQPASQDSPGERVTGARGDITNHDRRPTPPPLLLHAEGRRYGGFEERREQQCYSAEGRVQRDDDNDRRRPAAYHGAQPPSSRDGSRRDLYDNGRLPPRRDEYSDQRPLPPRRKDEPCGDWRLRGPPPPSIQQREVYDDRSRPSVGAARGPSRDDYLDRRPPASHAPLPVTGNAAAAVTGGGQQRGDLHEGRRPQLPPPGRGNEGYRDREWVERGGGSSISTRGYGRDVGPSPRREGLSSDRSGWERERERHMDRDRDRDRDYRLREREREREGLAARSFPSQGPSSYHRDAVASGGGVSATRRSGSPLPASKRPRTSPPRSGTGSGYPAYDHRQHQQPPPYHHHAPHPGPGSGGAPGGEGAALSSADIVRAMMAAPAGGAPVAGMGATGHAGPIGGSGPGSGSGSEYIAANASATVTANSSQLTAEQKRKLLWGAKKVEAVISQGAESLFGANRWDRAAEILETDRDKEKFQRLMGLKGDMAHRSALPMVEARPSSPGAESHLAMTREQQERVLGEVEQQYLAGLKRKDGRTAGLGM